MKILNDKTEVPDRIYYYLEHFAQDNRSHFTTLFSKDNVSELTSEEFRHLFKIATTIDKHEIEFGMKLSGNYNQMITQNGTY